MCFAVAEWPDSGPLVRVTPDSSALTWIAYNARRRVLYAQFKRGDIYRYGDVDGDTAQELFASRSAGKGFNRLIKDKFVGVCIATRGVKI